jgi:hypothetical protein
MKSVNQRVQLDLTIEEINLILTALGQMPYVQVVKILDNISKQAEFQLKPNEEQYKESK